jgi:hypothetical protein
MTIEAAGTGYFEVDGLRPRTRPTFDIVGQYEAFIVMTHVDAAIARDILQPGLELAPPNGTPAGRHPVMYSFGKHRHVHPDALHVYEYDYDEALVGLPHVRGKGSGQDCFHMTDVRLNNSVAQGIGLALGMPKHLAAIRNADTSYRVADRIGNTLLTATMSLDGEKFDETHKHFRLIADMMQQPVISKMAGRTIITHFTFDTVHACMNPARLPIEVTTDALAGMPRCSYKYGTNDEAQFGGAYMSIHSWRISQPPLVVL